MKKKKVFKAAITYNMTSEHPDIDCVENPKEALTFEDTYYMDIEYWDNNEEEMIYFIKHDLALVAGGGYSTEHIYNVKFNIEKIYNAPPLAVSTFKF